jgi:hypothetical protein
MPTSCQACGHSVGDGMAFCPGCGTATGASGYQGNQQYQSPPVYSMHPQHAQGPYPVPVFYPYPNPYVYRSNPKHTAAGGGCTVMILDGALAIPMWLLLLVAGEPVSGVILMAASLVAIVGGSLALKGILPWLAAAGPPMLLFAAMVISTVDPFFIVVGLIGGVLGFLSLILVFYGWEDLMERARTREMALQAMRRY